ncbi:MAG: preprotein translocase subunit SecG [Rhodopseudomonas sp.]|nr:preprotein translocase subunit SecG [Rhodopseudomonas sp.]
MQQVIIVIHLMLVLALIGVVLLQRSEGGGLGIGGGGGSFMSSRGAGNVLTRATAILAGLFFATSLILSILAGMGRKPTSILGGSGPSAPISAPAAPGSTPPLGGGEGGGLLKQLQGGPPAAPAAPAAPAGPQVPQSK